MLLMSAHAKRTPTIEKDTRRQVHAMIVMISSTDIALSLADAERIRPAASFGHQQVPLDLWK